MEKKIVKNLNNFKKTLKDQIEKKCKEMNWQFNNNKQRGMAFQLWCADLWKERFDGIESEPSESTLETSDLGVDVYLEDSGNETIYILQCKYTGSGSKKSNINEDQVNSFLSVHNKLTDRDFIRKHGGQKAIELLEDYSIKMDKGYSAKYYFISTESSTERIEDIINKENKKFETDDVDAEFFSIGVSSLKDFYNQSKSLKENIPEKVEIILREGHSVLKEQPRKTIVSIVKGNSLRDLFQQHKDSLFARNIRSYIGHNKFNKKIKETAENNPDDFFI